jgi:hypothetical protein
MVRMRDVSIVSAARQCTMTPRTERQSNDNNSRASSEHEPAHAPMPLFPPASSVTAPTPATTASRRTVTAHTTIHDPSRTHTTHIYGTTLYSTVLHCIAPCPAPLRAAPRRHRHRATPQRRQQSPTPVSALGLASRAVAAYTGYRMDGFVRLGLKRDGETMREKTRDKIV